MNGYTKPTPNDNPKFNLTRYLQQELELRGFSKGEARKFATRHTQCHDCGEYAYSLGECNECGITDGYLWCQRCGEPCWNIEQTQCENCGFTD